MLTRPGLFSCAWQFELEAIQSSGVRVIFILASCASNHAILSTARRLGMLKGYSWILLHPPHVCQLRTSPSPSPFSSSSLFCSHPHLLPFHLCVCSECGWVVGRGDAGDVPGGAGASVEWALGRGGGEHGAGHTTGGDTQRAAGVLRQPAAQPDAGRDHHVSRLTLPCQHPRHVDLPYPTRRAVEADAQCVSTSHICVQ